METLAIGCLWGLGVAASVAALLSLREQDEWGKNLQGTSPSHPVGGWVGLLARFIEKGKAFLERSKVRRRALVELPDFFDLLGLGLSSGLNIENAWMLALRHTPSGIVKKNLQAVLQSLAVGRSREESFLDLARRLGDSRLRLFFVLLVQSMKTGSRLQNAFHDQAASLRQHRMTEIERKAQTASLRLLVPMFIFIFPTIFVILFAPLVIRLSTGGSLF